MGHTGHMPPSRYASIVTLSLSLDRCVHSHIVRIKLNLIVIIFSNRIQGPRDSYIYFFNIKPVKVIIFEKKITIRFNLV